MNLNADFRARVVVHTEAMPWLASPVSGVERRMLDRIGGEVARATTVVRYAPGSRFSPHVHGGGEEFLVLDGVFQDEHGDYPAGTYVRNPPQSSHMPGTVVGATILVKLWQFDTNDRTPVRIDTRKETPVPVNSAVQRIPLYRDSRETVRLEFWSPDAPVAINGHKGLEIFVLDGSFQEAGDILVSHSWLRLPAGHDCSAMAGPAGAIAWIKSDHFAADPIGPA